VGVFVDIEGANNNTSYDFMSAALVRHGVVYTIAQWIGATLEGWLATATLNGYSMRVVVSRGCPQGVELSQLLRCVVVDNLLARISVVIYKSILSGIR